MMADGQSHRGDITYRSAGVGDAAALVPYMAQILKESEYLTHDPQDRPHSERQLRATINEAAQTANQLLLLALEADAVVGLLRFRGGVTRRTRHSGELGITVRKARWGQGVATNLLSRFFKWAEENGVIRQVNLRVRPDNQRALALYRRHGFAITGRMNRELVIDGRFHDHLIMGLSVEPPAPVPIREKGESAAMPHHPPYQQVGTFTYLAAPDHLNRQRPTLIFLHGSGHNARFWEHQLSSAALTSVANCLALDLPGHGENTAAVCRSVAQHADQVAEFLDAIGIGTGPVVPVGLSLGGAIVQWLLLHHPERCRAGVIVNSGARLRVAPLIFETLEKDYQGYLERLKEMALSPANRDANAIDAFLERCTTADAALTAADFRCCDNFDVMADLDRIDRPVLVMAASEDQLTPPKYGVYLEEAIPGARRVTLSGVGHLSPVESPTAFNASLAGFVASLNR